MYLAAWVPLTALITLLLILSGGLTLREALALGVPLTFFYASICLAAWYPASATPLRANAIVRIIATHAVAASASSGVWLLIGGAWARALLRWGVLSGPLERITLLAPLAFAVGALLFLLSVAVHYVLIAVEASRQAEKRGLELAVLAREAELKALRAQVDPHFLFNALTGIDPAGARRMCLLLGDFLRESLRLGSRDEITLAEELALADRFLAIENIRFGNRLTVHRQVEPECEASLVPSLLLQPLVENAITHGVGELVDGGIVTVAARRNGPTLEVTISNPRDPDARRRGGSGVGLQNVRKRLEVRFGSAAWINVRPTETAFEVRIGLPVTSS